MHECYNKNKDAYVVVISIRLEIGNRTGISNEMHAYVLRKKKLPRNYVDVIKNDSCTAVDVDFYLMLMPHLYNIAPILRFYIGFATVEVGGCTLYNRKGLGQHVFDVLSIFELKLAV